MAPSNNLSAVLHKKNDLRLEETEIPEPGPDEVEITIHTVGICGTDLHFWLDGHTGKFVMREPMVLGHETSAVVSKVGSQVKHLSVGDHVAIEPNTVCRMCEFCTQGRYNLCQAIDLCQITPLRGHLRRRALCRADLAHKVPKNLPLGEVALIEPFAVAVHACRRARMSAGQRVLITGAGPIGLLCLLAAKAYGAGQIVQVDLIDRKLELAKACGADFTLNSKGMEPSKAAQEIKKLFDGEEPEVTFECTGAQACHQTAIMALKPGGVLAMVGMGANNITVPIMEAIVKEIDIKGVFCYANCYATAISLLASGRVNFKPLISHTFPLEQTLEAFEVARTGSGGAVKVQIKCYQD